MSFHLLAHNVAIGTTADTEITAVTDGLFTIQNSHFVPKKDYDLIWAYAAAATLNRVRISTPAHRQVSLPFIRPIRVGTLPGAEARIADYTEYPLRMSREEEIVIQGTSDIAMGTEQAFTFLALSEGIMPAPRGRIYTMRGTSTTAVVARTWTVVSVTWAEQLPVGRYACVGLGYIATNAVAARLNFFDQWVRPGVIGNVALGDAPWRKFAKGQLGIFGEFTSTTLPTVEVFNNSTDNSHTFYFDFVRLA